MKTSALPGSTLARTLRQLVGFSRRETRGFIVLLMMLVALVLLPLLVGRWLGPQQTPVVTNEDVRTLDHLTAELERTERTPHYARAGYSADNGEQPARAWRRDGNGSRYNHSRYDAAPVPVLKHLLPFDPNALSALDWQRRGVPADVARRLVSYGRKAGGYRYREQLERIHGLDPQLLARLTPYLQLPSRQERYATDRPARRPYSETPALPTALAAASTAQPEAATAPAAARPGFVRKPRVVQAFDLNTADTTTLMQLRGIGRKRAARILETREKLGGFISTAQLADVWGLDPELIDSVARYAHVAPDFQPKPLPINSATPEELRTHPYLGYRLARVVVAFREQHGPFTRVEDLRQIKILDDATYQKLLPYVALR